MEATAPTHEPRAVTSLGQLLREWRAARGLSQLDLAMRAGFSSRHVSFIETGKTQPSRHALLVLAETLEVPLRERNRLLEAGGYARVYRQTPLAAEEMRHIRGVLQFILDRHEPYGAVVLDRYSNLLMGNQAATRLLTPLVDSSLLLFSTIMTLGTPQDVTLQELRIETFFPADQDSEALLKSLA
jgi:transcriptional regulator with XRE-family HTH domain